MMNRIETTLEVTFVVVPPLKEEELVGWFQRSVLDQI